MVLYRTLDAREISPALFHSFVRTQRVTRCWRKVCGEWVVQDISFIDDWTGEDYAALALDLIDTVRAGGFVMGAFLDGALKGFTAVKPEAFGSEGQYLDLDSIHVSQDARRMGIGRELFLMAKSWAKERGAKKLYISAHSSVESQDFYRAMGCVEAAEYNQALVEKEPCDCQLECAL